MKRLVAALGALALSALLSSCGGVGLSAAVEGPPTSYTPYQHTLFRSCYPSSWSMTEGPEGVRFVGATTASVRTSLILSFVTPPLGGAGTEAARALHDYELRSGGRSSTELAAATVDGREAFRMRLVRNDGAPGSEYQAQVVDIGTARTAFRFELRSAPSTADELLPVFNHVLECTRFNAP